MVSTAQLYARAHEISRARSIGNSGAPFMGQIQQVDPATEVMTVRHGSGLAPNVRIPHPYVGVNSWHRVAPDAGQQVVMHVRQDGRVPIATAFHSAPNRESTPEERVRRYNRNQDLYRPLVQGEQELSSAGGAQVFLGRRPYAEVRGGYVRSWWDQDRLEAGARAGLHVRQLQDNRPTSLTDEERFGVVQRADQVSTLSGQDITSAVSTAQQTASGSTGALAKSSTRVKFIQAPTGANPAGPPAPVNVSAASDPAAVASTATSVTFVPAKERTWILTGSLGRLAERFEGHVMSEDGQALKGKFQNDLRYLHQIYGVTSATSSVSGVSGASGSSSSSSGSDEIDTSAASGVGSANYRHEIDANGNVYIGLPATASDGHKVEVPIGKYEVRSGTASVRFLMDGPQSNMQLRSTMKALLRAEQETKVHAAQVKLGLTEAAVNKAVSTINYKTSERGLHLAKSGLHLAGSVIDLVAGNGLNALGSVLSAISAAVLCPGVLVFLMGRAHTLVGFLAHQAKQTVKQLLSQAGVIYGLGWDTLYESASVSYSS
jgi:hypothetical protein